MIDDLIYPITLGLMIILQLTIHLLISNETAIKFSSVILLNFFIAIILAMYFLKRDSSENRYLKQRVNSYPLYVSTQILFMVLINAVTAIISGIFTFLFSDTPAANGTMFLTLMTTAWIGSAIIFVCRSMMTNHKYIATICFLLIVLFSLADSNNDILSYINWILPPVSNLITTFQERTEMVALLPLVLRQFVYSILLFAIGGLFNKKKLRKLK